MNFFRIMRGVGLAVLAVVLGPCAAGAAETTAQASGSGAPDLFGAGLKMFGALLVVIAGLLLVLRLLKRLGLAQGALAGGQEVIRVLATRHLSPKNSVTVVEVGGRVLTLGVTGERIACLDKMSAAEFQESRPLEEPAAEAGAFARRLKALTGVAPISGAKNSHDS